MIVIRFIEDNGDLSGDQEIFCNNPCYPNFKGYLENFEIYSDVVIDHKNFDGLWPTISDFISEDSEEYCFNCEKQLNIFDEDLNCFVPNTQQIDSEGINTSDMTANNVIRALLDTIEGHK